MESAERLVAGEWFEIRERLRRPDEIHEYLTRTATRQSQIHRPLAAVEIGSAGRELEQAIEGGIFEYKRSVLLHLEREFAEAEFSNDVFESIGMFADRTGAWLLATIWERALLTQEADFKRMSPAMRNEADGEPAEEEGDPSAPTIQGDEDGDNGAAEIRRIISDVHQIVEADPSARMHSAIKSIMIQLRKYREEAETYRKLREKASNYRVELYSRTFAATFQKIFETIRRNYDSYQEEQRQMHRRERASLVEDLDTREWVRIITDQVEQVSRIRAFLLFLDEQHTGLREPLVDLGRDARVVRRLVDDEEDQAAEICGGEHAASRLGRIIATECGGRLRRWANG